MRIPCPFCGERGVEEFAYLGAVGPTRPDYASASPEAWHDYVYLRDNVAGPHRELMQHVHGCRRWLLVTRDTRNHAIAAAEPATERASAPQGA